MKSTLQMLMTSILNVKTLTANYSIQAKEMFVNESGTQHDQSIVFLHGSGSRSKMWLKHIAVFDSSFHCLAPDLPKLSDICNAAQKSGQFAIVR